MELIETDIRKTTQDPEEQSLFLINAWPTLDATDSSQDDFDKLSGIHCMVVLVRMINSMLPAEDREQRSTSRRNDVNPFMTRTWRNAPQNLKSDPFVRMIKKWGPQCESLKFRNLVQAERMNSTLWARHDQGLFDKMIWHPEQGVRVDATYENDLLEISGAPKDIAATIESMSCTLVNDGPETFCYLPRISMYARFLYTPDADRSDDDAKELRFLTIRDERPEAENPTRYVLFVAVRLGTDEEDADRIRVFRCDGSPYPPPVSDEYARLDWEVGAPGHTNFLLYCRSDWTTDIADNEVFSPDPGSQLLRENTLQVFGAGLQPIPQFGGAVPQAPARQRPEPSIRPAPAPSVHAAGQPVQRSRASIGQRPELLPPPASSGSSRTSSGQAGNVPSSETAVNTSPAKQKQPTTPKTTRQKGVFRSSPTDSLGAEASMMEFD
ncbi:hypothetical protein CCUS01_11371 [Colletotrichum cuscutae]|uniref:Uncharacterized protein n=1 Tax=Colletotrichum cuscutae TaxID=1209917 RepID=A0AAI9U5X3_9PEZI|nr:hypothetical protein CCUS01_11371 [Colletotrichum cuscutae]